MAERSSKSSIPHEIATKILGFPETHMGVQTVALVLRDGRTLEDVQIAWGSEVIGVEGDRDEAVPWDQVVEVLDRS